MDDSDITSVDSEISPAEILNRILATVIYRRWWFLTTASVTILATLAALARTPNRYTSEATIIVAEQRVPERYVVPTSTTDLTKDLQTMEGEVLSRTRLFSLMDEFGLYAKERKKRAPEQMLDLMMRDIRIEPLTAVGPQKESDSFKVSFTSEDPVIAQEVTSRLASLFIENNVKGREDQAVNTTKFLKDELDSAQKKLSGLEQNLRDFKMQHLGELPEQQQGNLAILSGLQTQLQTTTSSIARAEQQRVYLESLVNTLHGLSKPVAVASPQTTSRKEAEPADEAILGAELRLAHLQTERNTLVSLRGPNDPDVINLNVDIARTNALVQKLKAAQPQPEKPPPAETTTEDTSLAQLKSQLEANRVEMGNLAHDEKQLKESIAQYQSRLNQTPIREQQLAGLARDIDLVRQQYADLLKKEHESQMAATLEKQQGGQQFRLLEPPSLPTLPSSPKRVQLGVGAGLGGFALGFVAAFLADLKKRAFYLEKEVSRYYDLPLVVGVPLVLTAREERLRAWRRAGEWIGGAALIFLICAAELIYLRGFQIFA